MPPDNTLRPGVGAFLRQLLDDVSCGAVRSLKDYQARFPEADDDVAALYEELHGAVGGIAAKVSQTADVAPPLPRAASNPGERILGDFRLLREIGRGGMGVVYEAEQISLGRSVAVKVLANSLALDPRARARFERESRLAAQLDHPGIAKVLAAEASDDVLFYAMEFVQGAPLDRVLQDNQATPADRMTGTVLQNSVVKVTGAQRTSKAARTAATTAATGAEASHWRPGHIDTVVGIAAQVALALHHAHQQGVVHRDVKPANIMVRPNGTAVLTDFGLARGDSVSALTATGDFLGTPFYVAPEQVTAGQMPIDHRADVFSLGVTLYELLTHRRPFEAKTAVELRVSILIKEPVRPQKVNRQVPHDLGCIVLKALEKDPDRRYPTALAFADDLRAFLAGRPVVARPVSGWTRTLRWTRRNPLASTFVAVLAVGLVTVGGLLVVTRNALEERDGLALAGRALALMRREREEFPPWPERVPALATLLAEAEQLAAFQSAQQRYAQRSSGLATLMQDIVRTSLQDLAHIQRHELPSLRARLQWAQMVQSRSVIEHNDDWERAIATIRTDPRYAGLKIGPQTGLIPLGPDPDSGLWEFAELTSGEIAKRDPSSKQLSITPGVGIVFVLIPEGSFTMGAQSADPTAASYDTAAMPFDGPPRQVTLSAFFLAKYELTNEQWQKLSVLEAVAGRSHKALAPDEAAKLLYPVQDLPWVACDRVLCVNGLSLPTEAQWEYACRAGTTTRWWTGADADSLDAAANIADAAARDAGDGDFFGIGEQNYAVFDDGYRPAAPIGERRANAFGLHDMHGNLGEWCRDWFNNESKPDPETLRPGAGDGFLDRPVTGEKAIRGGSFGEPALHARCARRNGAVPGASFAIVGVRACRSVLPASMK